MKLTRRIDDLSPVRQTSAWLGLSLIAYLSIMLVLVITRTPVPDSKVGFFWVLLSTMAGVTGSKIRNK